MATMRAARYYGKEDIRIEYDIPVPKCGEGQVLIEPAFVGICGTDLHEYTGGPNFIPTSPHPITKESAPVTIGHEFSGTIVELGAGVTHLQVGQKVAVQPTIYCGTCGPCGVESENTCSNGGFLGLSGYGGGLSERIAVPVEAVFPLPGNVELDVGALVEPLAVAWHAVDASPLPTAAEPPKCLVLGGGPIGLAIIQVLLARNAKLVVCAEVAKKRREFATQFGAHHVIDPTKHDVVSTVTELCGSINGPDIVFDCAGAPKTLETACKAVRSRGTIVNLAIWGKEVPFNPNWLVFREAIYRAVLGYQKKDFEGIIRALEDGSLKPSGMITGKIEMGRLIEDGYRPLIHEKDKHVKILVDVKAGA